MVKATYQRGEKGNFLWLLGTYRQTIRKWHSLKRQLSLMQLMAVYFIYDLFSLLFNTILILNNIFSNYDVLYMCVHLNNDCKGVQRVARANAERRGCMCNSKEHEEWTRRVRGRDNARNAVITHGGPVRGCARDLQWRARGGGGDNA
jgi:hypothetical protein